MTNVPPPVLWINTVRQAAEMSLAGLTFETFTEAGTSSWTEVPFGGEVPEDPPVSLPWDPTRPVVLPGTDIHIRGKIDRLDLRASAVAVRVTDYKTGQRPKASDQLNINGGAELQRVLYSLACRQLLPDTKPLIARLIYLRPPLKASPLKNPDGFIDLVAAWVKLARSILEAGVVYPASPPCPTIGSAGSRYLRRPATSNAKATPFAKRQAGSSQPIGGRSDPETGRKAT